MIRERGSAGRGRCLTRPAVAVGLLLLVLLGWVGLGAAQATIPLPEGVEVVQVGIADLGCEHGNDLFVVGRAPFVPDRWYAPWTADPWSIEADAADPDKGYILLPAHFPRPEAPDLVGVAYVYTSAGDGRYWDPAGEWPMYLEHEVRSYTADRAYQARSASIGLEVATYAFPTPDGLLVFGGGWPQVGELPPLHGFLLPVEDGVGEQAWPLNWASFVSDSRPYRLAALRLGEASDRVVVGNFNGQVGNTFVVIGGQSESFETAPGVSEKRYPLVVFRETDGQYEERQRLPVGALGAAPELVAVGDLTGNGYDDLVVACSGVLVDRLYVYLSNGDGTFRAVSGGVQWTEGDPRALVSGDFNGSGRADLLFVGQPGTQAQVFFGGGDGTFEKGPRTPFGLSDRGSQRVAVADFDRDGSLDLVLATGGEVRFYWGRGDGNFTAGTVLTTDGLRALLEADAFVPSMVMPMQLDEVSRGPALVIVSESSREIAILANRGNRTFEAVPAPLVGQGVGAMSVAPEDPGSVAQVKTADRAVRMLSPGPRTDEGLPSFVPDDPQNVPGIGLPYDVALADLTGDQRLDAAVSGLPDRRSAVGVVAINVAGRTGDDAWQIVDVGRRPVQLLPLLGEDGRYLAVLNAGSDNISLLQYDAALGRARVGQTVQLSRDPTAMYAADLTGDGLDDLVVLYRDLERLELRTKTNGFTVGSELSLPAGADALRLPFLAALADLSGDEVPDLVVVDEATGALDTREYRIRVFEGAVDTTGYRLYGEVWTGTVGMRPTSVVALPGGEGFGRARIVLSGRTRPFVMAFDRNADGGFAEVQIEPNDCFYGLDGERADAVGLDGVVAARHGEDLVLLGFSERRDAQQRDTFVIQLTPPRNGVVPVTPMGAIVVDVAAGDITGDGAEELVFLSRDEGLGDQPLHAVFVSAEWDAGLQRPRYDILGQVALELGAGRVLVGDVDGDGIAELIVLYPRTGKVSVYWGKGVGEDELQLEFPSTLNTEPIAGATFPFSFHGGSGARTYIVAGSSLVVAERGDRGSVRVERLPLGGNAAKAAAFLRLPGQGNVGLAVLADTLESHHKLYAFELSLHGAYTGPSIQQTLAVLGEPLAVSAAGLSGSETQQVCIIYRDRADVVVVDWECLLAGSDLRQAPRFSTGHYWPMLSAAGDIVSVGGLDLVVMGEWATTLSILSSIDGVLNRFEIALPRSFGTGTRMLLSDLSGDGGCEVVVWTPGTKQVWIISPHEEGQRSQQELRLGEDKLLLEWVPVEISDAQGLGTLAPCEPEEISLALRVQVNSEYAREPPGPTVPLEGSVELVYEVTNPGQVELTDVEITDSVLGRIGIVEFLPPGTSKVLSRTSGVEQGEQVHTAKAEALHGGVLYEAQDRAHYFGGQAALSLVVLIDGARVSEPPGPTIRVGDEVTLTYELTNTSDLALADVEISDSLLGLIGVVESLAPGESVSFTRRMEVGEGDWTHAATARGAYRGISCVDRDVAHYIGALDFGWMCRSADEPSVLPKELTFIQAERPAERGPQVIAYCPATTSLWAFSLVEGSHRLWPVWSLRLPLGGDLQSVVADVSGNGYLDVVIVPDHGNEIFAVWGGAEAPKEICSWRLAGRAAHIAVGDLAGDGYADLAVSLPELQQVVLLANGGTGWEEVNLPFPGRPGAVGIVEGGPRGQVEAGLAVLESVAGEVLFHADPFTAARAGDDAAGGFSNLLPRAYTWTPVDLAIDDIDGDGAQDIVVLGRDPAGGEQPVVTVLNRRGRLFQVREQFTTGWDVAQLVLADVSGNGLADLIVVEQDSAPRFFFAVIRMYLNSADGFSREPVVLCPEKTPNSVLVGDLRGSGVSDILVGTGEGVVWAFWGDPRGDVGALHESGGERVGIATDVGLGGGE